MPDDGEQRRKYRCCADDPAAWRVLGLAHAAKGEYDAAIEAHEKACGLTGDSPSFKGPLVLAHAQAGHTDAARRMLESLTAAYGEQPVSAHDIAAIHAALEEPSEAFEWLGRAVDQHADQVPYLGVHPVLDPLRDDLRFVALKRRIGLS